MNKNSFIYWIIIAILFLCLLGAVAMILIQRSQGGLSLPFLTPAQSATAVSADASPAAPSAKVTIVMPKTSVSPLLATSTPEASTAGTKPAACGQQGSQTYLIVARDASFWESPYGADAIRLAHVNFDATTASIISLPRTLVVSTPKLEAAYGIKTSQLGDIYALVIQREGGRDSPEANLKAVEALAQAVYDNFGVAPQHYFVMKENSLWKTIDALGGVQVSLPQALQISGISYPAGAQTLTGERAQWYARHLPSNASEWDRLQRQDLLLSGIKQRLAEPDILLKVPALYQQFQSSLITDLNLEHITQLACVGQKMSSGQMTVEALPQKMCTPGQNGSLKLSDLQSAQQWIASKLGQ
ncbi:LCP family protein [Levilinea saccharolytica]|uniref:Cell envelope-related transcriptional attenuator domain-containing protein n=1 Tax=Levilinea saccharolytica TaxID=229921 RepID=A0A0P6XT26_9CHLR|nr:LCP family protein [Levilinea saccharolytica]KPL83463.1 hypothetical protein ADN01_08125 [Levilinea saccharolytica]GAP18247.1 transcriptional regulator [Levilinea saccharolytica]